MRRLYEPATYRENPASWWDETAPPKIAAPLEQDLTTEVAIVGGGFTGMSAALQLAKAGIQAIVLDEHWPGWGASRRNGGFCCLGGSKASETALRRRFGEDGRRAWHATEKAAVGFVDALIGEHGLDVDRHSQGETQLAHNRRAFDAMRDDLDRIATDYGVRPVLHEQGDLIELGMVGSFFGGVTIPLGFALNPAKYHGGLTEVAQSRGVQVFGHSPVEQIVPDQGRWRLRTPRGSVIARTVILATNGYSSEDLPCWLRSRYLPVQSSIIVTRPLTVDEQSTQGWTSAQMAYDSRTLLHYFRLMPDGRFLFGMRGGLTASQREQEKIRQQIRADFHAMFPAWRHAEITHDWNGLVCLMPNLTPFVGAIPDMPGLFAAMGYHGNGVAMGSYCGALVTHRILGTRPPGPDPELLQVPPPRFPFGRFRRGLLRPAYALASLLDR